MPHPWRSHPKLQPLLLADPQFADDVQVVVHEGGPRTTKRHPEAIWVRVFDHAGHLFRARLLNQPNQLPSLQAGDAIQFIVPAGGPHPIMVREDYLAERPNWDITPCNGCRFSELFDPPSVLIRRIFPDLRAGDQLTSFTTFCPLCPGIQVVTNLAAEATGDESLPPTGAPAPSKKWYQFWK